MSLTHDLFAADCYLVGLTPSLGEDRILEIGSRIGAAAFKIEMIKMAVEETGVEFCYIGLLQNSIFDRSRAEMRDNRKTITVASRYKGAFGRVLLSIFFFLTCFKIKKLQTSRIIFYNCAVEYLLGFILLKIRGFRCFIDVEDFPRANSSCFREFLDKYMIFPVMLRFSDQNKMIAATGIKNFLGNRDRCFFFPGMFYEKNGHLVKIEEKKNREILFHLGGTIKKSSGLDLFEETIARLASSKLNRNISFIVTGFIDSRTIQRWKTIVSRNEAIKITWKNNVDRDEYERILKGVDVGLDLRNPESDLVLTTFPSKIFEYINSRIVVVSSATPDVIRVTQQLGGFYFSPYDSKSLAELCLTIAGSPKLLETKRHEFEDLFHNRFLKKGLKKEFGEFLGYR